MIKIQNKHIVKKEHVTVDFLYKIVKDKFQLSLFTNTSGFDRKIYENHLHRPGLALAGFVELFSYTRVQIFGNTEMKYLNQLDEPARIETLKRIFQFDIPCIILTDGNNPFAEMIDLANDNNIPMFGTKYSTTKISFLISDFLDDQFASRVSIHGSFVDVYGIGILFIGKSGIGKSEVALDLVERGHRLVADDVIIVTKKGEGILIGSGTELVKHFMEVRGIGIIDVKSIFGVRSIRFQKRLEIIVELELWDDKQEYTRTGLEDKTANILDEEIPYIRLPIIPGKNITVIAEVIALNYLLKHYGYEPAKVLQKRLEEKIANKVKLEDRRFIDYFEHDFE
ncbi:MAG: HPr(Ser) kinase/phosphatase [Ignavibacteriales bacterium]|nr:HPr(Ser) kinase/phosphatase [Ignavibacteriales bacterium]